MNGTPARPMYARQNDDGVSVNESAVCAGCLYNSDALDASYVWWKNADDVTGTEADDTLYPSDNPDGRCNGCGAVTLWDETENAR